MATIKPAFLRKSSSFYTLEMLTVSYAILTSFIVFALWRELDNPILLIQTRLFVLVGTLIIYYFAYFLKFKWFTAIIRIGFPLILLSAWYGETYQFCKLFPNLDHIFASVEQWVFGFQPALIFSQKLSARWISEAFYMGYFFYFPMMVTVLLYCFFFKRGEFNRLGFIFLGSFFLYYLTYYFVPVAGPQFYFPVIGLESVENGVFPAVGDYFRYHSELESGPGYTRGIFYRMVGMSQDAGEHPTAAFPSSHVGISTILMIWLLFNNKKILFTLLPFYILLCGATVYIQAHYAIDVIAGWISAILFYIALNIIFNKIKYRKPIDKTDT